MVQTFDCPICHKPVTADDGLRGSRVRCPHCHDEFTLPGGGIAAAVHLSRSAAMHSTLRFTFTCQRCGSALEGHSGISGQPGRCPTCGVVFTIPAVDRRTGLPLGPAEVAEDGELPTPMHAYAAAGTKAPVIRRRPNGDQYIVCPRCDAEASVDANICGRCGLPFTIEGAHAVAVGAVATANSAATASLVLGILGLVTFCFPLLGGLAVIFGGVALARTPHVGGQQPGRRHAIAGMVCGAIAIAAYVVKEIVG